MRVVALSTQLPKHAHLKYTVTMVKSPSEIRDIGSQVPQGARRVGERHTEEEYICHPDPVPALSEADQALPINSLDLLLLILWLLLH